MLAAPMGTEFHIELEDADAEFILEAVSVLIDNRFGEAE